MPQGFLQIIANTANKALPLSGVNLSVFNPETEETFFATTDENGYASLFSFDAPDRMLTLDQRYTGIPYSKVNVLAQKDGYQTIDITGVQIFDQETAILELPLSPLVDVDARANIINIQDNQLIRPMQRSCGSSTESNSTNFVLDYPIIPKTITVHLGRPTASADNVTVSFKDYIKNVASSEIYPTWPLQSLRVNIYCQISLALNRVYTEWYRAKGYNFDITNSTAYDQYFVYGRNIFESISRVVDDIFNEYIRKKNTVNPYYAEYCDGRSVWCNGLKQWGTVDLANQGRNAYEILRYYYGSDIEIVSTDRIEGIAGSYPGLSLKNGVRSDAVAIIQNQLNRIAVNYPNIPVIYPVDGIFGPMTEAAVRTFQKQFNLSQDGIVGKSTWYKISSIYVAVKRLAELTSEGIEERLNFEYPGIVLRQGDRNIYVQEVQFFLQKISVFTDRVPFVKIDSSFGSSTRAAVIAFQRLASITADGLVGPTTWNLLVRAYRDTLNVDVPTQQSMPAYPGTPLRIGSTGENVRIVQNALNVINQAEGNLSMIAVDGIYGNATANAVRSFQTASGLSADGVVGRATWNALRSQYSSVRVNPIAFSMINYELFQALYRNYTSLIYDIDNDERNN